MHVETSDARLIRYRWSSGWALILAYGPELLVHMLRLPDWVFTVAVFVAIAALFFLTVITWERLGEIGVWRGMIVLIVFGDRVGPTLFDAAHSGAHVTLTWGSLVACVPVVLGWLKPTLDKAAATQASPTS